MEAGRSFLLGGDGLDKCPILLKVEFLLQKATGL